MIVQHRKTVFKSMKRSIRIIVIAIVLIAIATLVIKSTDKRGIKKESAPLKPDSVGIQDELPVIGIRLDPTEFRDLISSSGVLEAWHHSYISSETGGRLVGWTAEIGDQLDSGEVIVRFDDELVRLQFNQAGAGLNAAQVALKKQKQDLEKYRKLLEEGSISKNDYESAQIGYESAEASLAAAEAAFGLAERSCNETAVKMPFKGCLASKLGEVGQSLPPGSPVVEIVKINPIRLRIGLSEMDIVKVKRGQSVSIKCTAWKDRIFKGEVFSVGIAANANTRLFPVEIVIPNKELLLKPGMAVSADVTAEIIPEALVVPLDVVIIEDEIARCFVVNQNHVELREVAIGRRQSGKVVLSSGVFPGETIIVTGHRNLKDGQRIALSLK